jgi:hypothetical protein
MLAYVPLWILIMAMVLEKIKLDKKSAKEYEFWRDAIYEALKEKNHGI